MSAQPEALRIADECEQSAEEWLQEVETRKQAAAELRRLHAENEMLKGTLKRGREVWIGSAEAWSRDVAEKDALLRQALELLEDNREDVARVETTYMHKCYDPVVHAIRHHLGQKGETG